jgi:anthranilate synthase component 1
MHPRSLKEGEVLPLVKSFAGPPDPLVLYRTLCGDGAKKDTLLLESGEIAPVKGEKSLIVAGSALRARCRGRTVEVRALNQNGMGLLPRMSKSVSDGAVVVECGGGFDVRYPPAAPGSEETRLKAPSPVDVLRVMAGSHKLVSGEPPLGPMVAGVFSYDFLGSYESLPEAKSDPLGWPEFEFWLPDRMVHIDHGLRSATAVFHVFGGPDSEKAYNDAAAGIAELAAIFPGVAGGERQIGAAKGGIAAVEDMGDAEFASLVVRLKEHIDAGDVFQIVASRLFSMPCKRPLEAYARLRELNPGPYMFLVNSDHGVLFGSSPETAVKVDGHPRRVEIRPIAGTGPRGRSGDGRIDWDLDGRNEASLRMDEKELAEHMMLVDLARNDVARVSRTGTRRIDRLLGVDRYSHVMHLVSHVSGELRDDLDGLSAYVATMNMGTLVGAPKIRAAELLRLYEPCRRGPYGGGVGYFTMDGRLDTCIVIRSAVVKDGTAFVRAGAGIVAGSDPSSEAEETRRKAGAVLQALADADAEGAEGGT